MSSKRLLIVLVAGSALAGCNTAQTHIGDESAVLGEARLESAGRHGQFIGDRSAASKSAAVVQQLPHRFGE